MKKHTGEQLEKHSAECELRNIRNALEFVKGVQADLKGPENVETVRGTDTPAAGNHEGGRQSEPRMAGSIPADGGRFRIERLIGSGGFANVFLGHDSDLDRPVAVKLLRESTGLSKEASVRFDREARAVATLDHPNIIPVYESGRYNGRRYIASAFCDGSNLKEWLADNQPVEPSDAAMIVATVAEAMHHAHQRGIVHRDLKPANILIERVTGGTGESIDASQLMVTDFGLARHDQSPDQFETIEGAVVGTPAYMSPEQAAGMRDISALSDVYSLGVLLYELLTGRLPILKDTHIQTLLAIPVDEPALPSTLRSTVDRNLEAICLKCLEKRPCDRYASAFELGADLRRWMQGQPVVARHADLVERAVKWSRRNPALALALTGLVVGLLFSIYQSRSAILQAGRADRHLMKTQEVIDEMVSSVATDSTLPRELRLSMAGRAVELQQELLAEQPDDTRVIRQTALALLSLSRVQADLLDFDSALESIDDALFVVDPYKGNAAIDQLSIRLAEHRIGVLRSLDRSEEAAAQIEEQNSNPDQTELQRAGNLFQSGMLKLQGNSDLEGAVEDFEESIEIYLEFAPESVHGYEYQIALSELFCGTAEMFRDNLVNARRHLAAAADGFRAVVSYAPDNFEAVDGLARTHLQTGRVLLGELRVNGLPADPDSQLLADCRYHFDVAADNFGRAIQLNDAVQGVYGRMAVVYEMRIKLETDQKSDDCGLSITRAYSDLFKRIPEDNPSRHLAGRILCESRLRVAKALIEVHDEVRARAELERCRTLLDILIEAYPDKPELQIVSDQCEGMLSQLAD